MIRRSCVCASEGRTLCAVCALSSWCKSRRQEARLFSTSRSEFGRCLRKWAQAAGLPDAAHYGSHAFRRGMAQDIIKSGGSLATLMRAGQWSSGAYRVYLQNHVLEEDAIAQLLIDHSDDEACDVHAGP